MFGDVDSFQIDNVASEIRTPQLNAVYPATPIFCAAGFGTVISNCILTLDVDTKMGAGYDHPGCGTGNRATLWEPLG
jgi:hypothetical protein